MKHGDQAKGKTAKAASQASGKKSSSKAVPKAQTAAGKSGQGSGEGGSKAESGGAEKARPFPPKGSALKAGDGGTGGKSAKGRPPAEDAGINNPVIAAAFKRAVKKYPNAFRKLTD